MKTLKLSILFVSILAFSFSSVISIKDKWLDSKLPLLTATQRKIVYERVRKFARK